MQHRDKSSPGVWDAFCWDRAEAGLNSGTAGSGFGVGVEAALWKRKFDGEKKEKINQECQFIKARRCFPSPLPAETLSHYSLTRKGCKFSCRVTITFGRATKSVGVAVTDAESAGAAGGEDLGSAGGTVGRAPRGASQAPPALPGRR